jgi:uncharacterized protein
LLYLLFEFVIVKIHLPTYPQGVHKIAETVSAVDLALDPDVFDMPIQTLLTLDRHDPYLQFTFGVEAQATLECDRCLTKFHYPLTVQAPMLYVLGRTAAADEPDDPEIAYVPAKAVELDITADLRDFIILAMPGKHLCKDDCRGLCLECGADLNTQTCPHVTT